MCAVCQIARSDHYSNTGRGTGSGVTAPGATPARVLRRSRAAPRARSISRERRSWRTAQTMPAIHSAAMAPATRATCWPVSADRLGDGLGVGEHDQATGGDAEHAGREVADQPGGDRGGDHAADEQGAGVAPLDALRAEREDEAQRAADGDHELRGVDRADHLARLEPARRQQGGGADGTPATAADRVERAADQAHRGQHRHRRAVLERRATPAEHQEAVDHVEAEREQQAGHPRLRRVAVEAGEERRAGERADEARHGQDRDGPPVDVAELVVGEAGHQRGADLGEVDGGGGGGRGHAGGQQQRGRRHAVRHAEGTVDELGQEAHEAEDEQLAHGGNTLRSLGGRTSTE